jgi:hypothetical protein
MWEYYVITELGIIYKDSQHKIHNKQFVILKETKHFVSYNGDLDSDETEYEAAVDLYYKQQMKKYDKIINLYECGKYIKPEFQRKYESRIKDLIPQDASLINVSKMKYTKLKW